MRKSLALQQQLGPVFDITFDCEDGAATGDEIGHAQLIAGLIVSDANLYHRVGVRVHDVGHPAFDAVLQILCSQAAHQLAYVTIPKVDSLEDVKLAISSLNRHAHPGGRTSVPVHVLIETQRALLDVRAIAALPQVEVLSFGIMDFVSSHYGAIPASAMCSPAQFTHPLVVRAKLEIAAACHAYGKVASHNVTTDIRDSAVVAQDAIRAAAEFGYTRMWSIHPDQIQPIVQAFTPGSTELHEASSILNRALSNQWGPIQHNGKLHDRASYRYYWTILQRARTGGLPLPENALRFF